MVRCCLDFFTWYCKHNCLIIWFSTELPWSLCIRSGSQVFQSILGQSWSVHFFFFHITMKSFDFAITPRMVRCRLDFFTWYNKHNCLIIWFSKELPWSLCIRSGSQVFQSILGQSWSVQFFFFHTTIKSFDFAINPRMVRYRLYFFTWYNKHNCLIIWFSKELPWSLCTRSGSQVFQSIFGQSWSVHFFILSYYD